MGSYGIEGTFAPILSDVSNRSITLGWMSFPKMSLSSARAGEPLISRGEKIRTIDVGFFTLCLTVAKQDHPVGLYVLPEDGAGAAQGRRATHQQEGEDQNNRRRLFHVVPHCGTGPYAARASTSRVAARGPVPVTFI